MRSIFILALLFFLLSTSGCVSRVTHAEELIETGSFDEAISVLENVLRDEPEDARAIKSLRRAREQWISRRLLEVRSLRFGGNPTGALELLNEIILKESRWQVYPAGAVAFTQGEEFEEASKLISRHVQHALKDQKPLKALHSLQRYRQILEASGSPSYEKMRASTRTLGSKTCAESIKKLNATDLFYARFLNRYCGAFGGGGPDLDRYLAAEGSVLYSNVGLSSDFSGKSRGLYEALERTLNTALRETPWYSDRSRRTLDLTGEGHFASALNQFSEIRRHYYDVKVPYTVTRTVRKHRPTPLPAQGSAHAVADAIHAASSVLTIAAMLAGGNVSAPAPTYNAPTDETETITETHYRTETHSFDYEVRNFVQKAQISILLAGELGEAPFSIEFTNEHQHTTFEHNNALPEKNLWPHLPQFADENVWINDDANLVSQKLKSTLRKKWESFHCVNSALARAVPEALHRCDLLYQGTQIERPAHVENWFQTQFGLSASETEAAIQSHPLAL